MATQDKSNYFDQFDTPAPSGTTPGAGNPFDQNDNVPNKPKNSLGKTVRDVGVDIVGGLGDIGKQAYGLANFMTAGTLDPATRKLGAIASEAITPVMNYFTGQNVEATSAADAPSIAQGLARNDQAVSDLHSDYRKMREQERSAAIQNADGFLAETGAAVKETLGNPSLLLGDVVRSAPSMLAPAVVGRKVATTFGPEAAEQAAQRALAAGATREAAQAAGQEAVDKLATRTVIGVTGLGQVGGGANIDTVNALHGTSAAALAQNPEYHLLRQQGLSEVEARDELARKAGLTATAIAAPMSMAASKLTGAGEQLARVATGRYGAQGWRQLGIAMGKEAAQEYPESFGEQYGQGVGLQHYGDPNTDPTKGAFGAAAMGALAGGVMGAGEHVAGWALHRGQPQSEAATGGNAPTQEQPPPDSMPPAGPTVPPASPAGLAPDQGPGAPAAPVLPPDAGPLARAASLAPTAPPAAPAAAAQTMFPFSDRQGAQKLADRLSADTGRPYEVGDHPQQPGRFAALPVTLNMEEPAFLKHAKRLHLHPLTAQMAAGDDSGALFDAMRDYYPEITAQQWRKPQERAKMAALFLNHEVAQLGQLLGETPTPTQAYLARQVGVKAAADMLTMSDMERSLPIASIVPDAALTQRLGLDGMTVGSALTTLTSRAEAKLAQLKEAGYGNVGTGVPTADQRAAGRNGVAPVGDAGRAGAVDAGPIAASGTGPDRLPDQPGAAGGQPGLADAVADDPATIAARLAAAGQDEAAPVYDEDEADTAPVAPQAVAGVPATTLGDASTVPAAKKERAPQGTFRDQVTDAYSNQVNHTLSVQDADGKVRGTLEYTEYNDEPSISMIDVAEDSQRQGYATQLVQELQRTFPDKEIDWGMMTDEGAALRKSLPQYQTPTEHAPAFERLQAARQERDKLMDEADALHAKGTLSEAEQARLAEVTAPLNGLHDEITDLEYQLLNKRPSKTLFGVPPAPQGTLVDSAAHEAASSPQNDLPEPTPAQIAAGNYKKGHVTLHGLDISIENPAGSTRKGTDREGNAWEATMQSHYGYIKGTRGADKDHIDTFIGPNPDSDKVFVVDQIDPATGKFDEHKVMLGYDGQGEAQEGYEANYAEDWEGGKRITATTLEDFKRWLKEGDTTKPFGTTPQEQARRDLNNRLQEVGRKMQAERLASNLATSAQNEANAPRGTNADGFAVRHHALREYAYTAPGNFAQTTADEFRANPELYARLANVTPDDVRRFADVIEQQIASKQKPVREKGQAAPARGATVDYPNRQLGFRYAATRPEEDYEPNAWADIAAANMKKGDTFQMNGKRQTVQSVSDKTLKLQDADGKVRTFNPDGVSWPQFRRDLAGQLTVENLDANNVLKPARPLIDILKRDPATHVDARGSVYLKDGGPVDVPAAPEATAQAAPAEAAPTTSQRDRLKAIAARLGIAVREAKSGFRSAQGEVDIPAEDAQVAGAQSAEHVFAHELGHAVMAQRQLSFKGFPRKEMLRWVSNWDELVAASRAYRPEVWKHKEDRIRRHAAKPDEVLADAIGAVLLGEQPLSLLKPLMGKNRLTEYDLGLKDAPLKSATPGAPAPASEEAVHSAQYDHYAQWIKDGKDVPSGMRAEIERDTRLHDGEAEELLAMLAAQDGKAPAETSQEGRRAVFRSGRTMPLDGVELSDETLAKIKADEKLTDSELGELVALMYEEIIDRGNGTPKLAAQIRRDKRLTPEQVRQLVQDTPIDTEAEQASLARTAAFAQRAKELLAQVQTVKTQAQLAPVKTALQTLAKDMAAVEDRFATLTKDAITDLSGIIQFNLKGNKADEKPRQAAKRVIRLLQEIAKFGEQSSAPEHAGNEYKVYDPDTKFVPTAPGASTEQATTVDEGVIPLTMNSEDFKEITDEWAALFEAPGATLDLAKDLAKGAKRDGFKTPNEAAAQLAEWKAHVAKQAADHRGENSQRTILSLFDLSGEWSKPWREAGYNVVTFDIQSGQDVNDFSVEYFNENYDLSDVYGILAAVPCTDFTQSANRYWKIKDANGKTEASKKLVMQTLNTIEYFRPKFWSLENPRLGRIQDVTGLPDPRLIFQPHNFGDAVTKETALYGKFNPNLPTVNVKPLGSKTNQTGGSSIETKNDRSETPEGFAYAFFMANNYIDLPPEQRLVGDFPELSGAIKQALKVGMTEAAIREAMQNTYEDYEVDEARNELITAVRDFVDGDTELDEDAMLEEEAVPEGGPTASFDEDEDDAQDDGEADDVTAPAPAADAEEAPAPTQGKVIDRYAGKYGNGMALGNAQIRAANQAKANPQYEYTVEDASDEFGPAKYVIVQREKGTAPDAVPVAPGLAKMRQAKADKDQTAQEAYNGPVQENQNDSTEQGSAAPLDPALDAGPATAGVPPAEPIRGAILADAGTGPDDGRGVRAPGGRTDGGTGPAQDVGHAGRDAGVPDAPPASVVRHRRAVSALDYRPSVADLARSGSWRDTAARNVAIIELALKIESENRAATIPEQAQLAKYVGFGAGEIRNALFPVPSAYARQQDRQRLIWPNLVAPAWKDLAERLDKLPRTWQESILQSTQYAHYTSAPVIQAIWNGVQRLGFTGGRVLEPGMGIGSFNMLMPDVLHDTSRYTGIEFDGPTALIARLLSPEQNMLHDDFIKRRVPKDYFDLAIGNPPFSATKIVSDPEYAKQNFALHDYFFAKSIDRVRPGGLLVFVTSRYTMDKASDKARKYLSDRADLVGAVRLPQTAFAGNAGTSVVTDVLFLRKRLPGEAPTGVAWNGLGELTTKDGKVLVNQYYAEHPDMILGQPRLSGNTDDQGRRINGLRGEGEFTVVSYDSDSAALEAKFAAAMDKLPQNVYSLTGADRATTQAEVGKVDFDPSVKREGVLYVGKDGALLKVTEGVGQPLANVVDGKLSPKDMLWLRDYVALRDMVRVAQQDQFNDGPWEKSLKALNKAYDTFRKTHGPIRDFRTQSRTTTDADGEEVVSTTRISKHRRLYRNDYDASLVTALETIAEDGSINKAPFLLGRTIGKPVQRDVRTIGDALAVSLDNLGRLDVADVARRLHLSQDEAIAALGDQIYRTPQGQYQMADEYLSGDVVEKLAEAEAAAADNPDLQRNVAALIAAQPQRLGPSQITVKLGASWVPAKYVNAFADHIDAGAVEFHPATEMWTVTGANSGRSRTAGAQWGTADRSPSELLDAVLNSRVIQVRYGKAAGKELEGKVNGPATTQANEVAKRIRAEFQSWVWRDTERATDVVDIYNRIANNIAPRRFDGTHLTLPGVSMRYNLFPHQKRAIWRIIASGDTYLAHAVGAGKTIEMIAAGMEQKRLGLVKKPMYVVPNHMLEQFANEFMELYPLANIMVADDENFTGERRRAFVAAATLNAPDAIILTHSAFKRISVKEESVKAIRDDILVELEMELDEVATDNGQRVRRSQLEQQIEAVKQRFDKIMGAGSKDNTIKFEDIGVDQLIVDEAHTFRKLDFSTAQQIKGIDPNGSQAALDMYVKTRHLQGVNPGRAMVFASGTPVTNTMGELYTIMRYFAPKMMNDLGIASFDAWSRAFGDVVAALEPNASGKYETVERFAKFVNLPELMSRVRSFMDVLTSEQLGGIVKRPDVEGGKPKMVIVPMSPQLKAYMADVLTPRLETSKKWKPTPQEPFNKDPVMNIITDGRFAALDPRYFRARLADDTPTKLTAMADEIIKEYHATSGDTFNDPQRPGKQEVIKGSTQIVFYNLGFGGSAADNRGFDARAELTRRLTAGGVKRDQIAWFDDANTDAKKEAIFKDMRSGKVRILIGSAKKMGTGVNVQKRLSALHYFDAPWYPADVEQPHGRILRQGNQHGQVRLFWYATKGTYDETMWQMVARKQRFIDQAFAGDVTLRTMEDVSPASLYEQAAAVSSGDPRAVQLAGMRLDVERYENLYSAHYNEQLSLRDEMRYAELDVAATTKVIARLDAANKLLGERYVSFDGGTVGKRSYDKAGEYGEALVREFNDSIELAMLKPQGMEIGKLDKATLRIEAEFRDRKPTGGASLYVEVGDIKRHVRAWQGPIPADASGSGLVSSITSQLNAIAPELTRERQRLADRQETLARGAKKLGAPFPYAQELAEKVKELRELEDQLLAEGKAPVPVADAPNQDTPPDDAGGAQVAQPDALYGRAAVDTPAFKAWFGKSLVVDHNEQPQVMYHASMRDVEWFDRLKSKEWRKVSTMDTVGSWFSDNPSREGGAGMYAGGEGSAIYPVYLSIQRPKVYDTFKDFLRDMHAAEGRRIEDQAAPGLGSAEGLRDYLKAQGYDGIAFTKTDTQELHDELAASLDSLQQAKNDEYSVKAVDRAPYTMKRQRIEERVDRLRKELQENGGSTEFDQQYVWVAFEPEQIKSAIGNSGAFDPAERSIVRQPETPYGGVAGEPSYNDPYDHTETRPGTTAAQLDAGRSAVADLARRIGAAHYTGRGNPAVRGEGRVLGQSLLDNFVAGQPNQLLGHTVTSPADLAMLAQVYRDPRFETFRVVFLQGTRVVGETGYTARMPGAVTLGPSFAAQLAGHKRAFGADGYYVMHNHPSGEAKPSDPDIALTKVLASKVPGMLGHVIIDHNEYGVIQPDGQSETVQDWLLNGVDFHGNPPVPHALLGHEIRSYLDVANLGKALQVPDGHATLVLTSKQKVVLMIDVPVAGLMDTSPQGIVKGRAMMRALARASGGNSLRFIVLPDGADAMTMAKWARAGVVTDVVTAGGISLAEHHAMGGAQDYGDSSKFALRVYQPPSQYGGPSPLQGPPAEVARRAGRVIKAQTYTRAVNALVDKRGMGLQFLGRRQLVELYARLFNQKDGHPNPMQEVQTLTMRMDAEINDAGATADALAVRWGKVQDADALAEVMHDATLAQFDPRPNRRLPDSMLTPEMRALRQRYNALSEEARKVFSEAAAAYQAHYKAVRLAIRNRIIRALPDHPRRAELLRQMDAEMFGQLQGIYFPLARFGEYVVRVQGPDGAVSVSRAETLSEAEALHKDLQREYAGKPGHTVMPIIRSKEFNAARDAVGRGFLQQLYGVIEASGDERNTPELLDAINQLYLTSLPDLSWAKHGLHRKGTPGYSQNARRAFAHNMFHGARYLAKLHYADRLTDSLDGMQEHIDANANDPKFDQVKAQQVMDEMVKRHDIYMNPKTHPLANFLTSAGFVFYLGLSPASAAVNLSQTALVAYPILGGKFGYGRASAALLRASKDAMSGHNDMSTVLTGDEKTAYDHWVKIGLIDVSMAHDLAGIAQGQEGPTNRYLAMAMKAASFMFHHAERFNRQATALAAYRLAREQGMDHEAAMESAVADTYAGHFDYSQGNRPRLMQGNVARVVLLFKQYAQNMIYTFTRNAALAFQGDRQALKTIGGLLTTHALAAGVLGLPLVTTLLAAASLIGSDDDEPWDAQVALRNMFAEAFGDKAGEALAHGLSRLTPWDISSRVGLDRLLLPDVQEGLEGQRFAESAMAGLLGPMAGLAVNLAKGLNTMGEGQFQRGLEEMAPAFVRGPLRSLRYFNEGVQDRTGVDILPETTLAEDAGQLLGFSPSRAREAQEGKSAIYRADKALQERRQSLMNQFAHAQMEQEDTGPALEAIQAFNLLHPNRQIAALHLQQSVRARMRRLAEAEQGVFLPKTRSDARAAGAFANPNE